MALPDAFLHPGRCGSCEEGSQRQVGSQCSQGHATKVAHQHLPVHPRSPRARLQKLKAEKIEILCMGQLVDPDWTCSFVYETMWEPFHIEGSKLTLFYRDPSRSAKHQ